MKAPEPTPLRLGDGPFVFRGKPPVISGNVELINDSAEKAKVRAIPTARGREGAIAREGFGELRLAARLEPGTRERVAAHFAVAPTTPPGRYTTELDLGDRRVPVVAHVFEKREVVLAPDPVELRGAPGDVLTHALVITNAGNVAQTLPEAALAHMEERDWFGRSMVYALREAGPDEGHAKYLDRVFKEMRTTDVAPVRVEIRDGGTEVAPGQTVETALTLTIPDKFVKGRTYVRDVPFMGTTLTVEIECNGSTKSTKRRPS